jgi:radical SAM protein with 4Fe4S-binding SPASM domain
MQKSDLLKIDSHKLSFHPHRLVQWLDGQLIAPVYVEISPTGSCNHRCTFCAIDFMEYRPNCLETGTLLECLSELGSMGVKSIMYAGEGEPLLHPDIAGIVSHTRSVGIDVAMSTNGVLLAPDISRRILPFMNWIKVSIDAGTPETYAAVHRTQPADFKKVLDNIASAARLASENGWPCTIGAQAILLPENVGEMEHLAGLCKDAGARYLVIKPYSQHLKSPNRRYTDMDYSHYLDGLHEKLERYNDDTFSIVLRGHAFAKLLSGARDYDRCLALPFWSYIDSAGNVWGCSSHMGDDRFLYGNITGKGFREVWTGPKRKRSLEFVASELKPEDCRMNCRMDEINRFLWELIHLPEHVNFI